MADGAFRISLARSVVDLSDAARLFADDADSIGADLSRQNFAEEPASLPGSYAAPRGALLLARDPAGAPAGCVALRPFGREGCCEMKRLYAAPHARGRGLGAALVQAVIAEAARIGYRRMLLDTLPDMRRAQALYAKAGFVPVDAYYETPLVGALSFALEMMNRP